MTQRMVMIDDLDGVSLTTKNGGTITFSIAEDRYEIDLSFEHTADLYRVLAPYIGAARFVGEDVPSKYRSRR